MGICELHTSDVFYFAAEIAWGMLKAVPEYAIVLTAAAFEWAIWHV